MVPAFQEPLSAQLYICLLSLLLFLWQIKDFCFLHAGRQECSHRTPAWPYADEFKSLAPPASMAHWRVTFPLEKIIWMFAVLLVVLILLIIFEISKRGKNQRACSIKYPLKVTGAVSGVSPIQRLAVQPTEIPTQQCNGAHMACAVSLGEILGRHPFPCPEESLNHTYGSKVQWYLS